MKAINLMRLILHINPVRTSLMRMNISQVIRHISATPQQVSCIRGKNVGIEMIYSLNREKSTAGCGVFRSSFWGWGGDWAFQTWPKALLLCPAGRCSWPGWGWAFPTSGRISALVPRKLSHNKPLRLQNYSGLTQNLEVSCQREGLQQGAEGSWGTLQPSPSSSWHWHQLGVPQVFPRMRGSCSATSSEQDSPLLGLDWHWICSRPCREWVKPVSLKPQGQIYRQKENSVIFFHVFIVTVKIGSYFQSGDTFIAHLFSHVLRHRESQQSKPGLGFSANYLWGNFLLPRWEQAAASALLHISLVPAMQRCSNVQPLQPIVNHFIKNTVWKNSFVKQDIKLRQKIHLGKCHQFKCSCPLLPLQCFPWL